MKKSVTMEIYFYGSVFQSDHFQSNDWQGAALPGLDGTLAARTAPPLQAQARQIREKPLIVGFIARV